MWPRSKRVRTPVVVLHSLSGLYPCEKYNPFYPCYGLNSITAVLLQGCLRPQITGVGWYATKQKYIKISENSLWDLEYTDWIPCRGVIPLKKTVSDGEATILELCEVYSAFS